MPKYINLAEDAQEFLEYTADEAYKELKLLQGHLETLTRGEKERFCLACAVKHWIGVVGLSQECVTAMCPVQPVWREMASWASEKKQKGLELLRSNKPMGYDEGVKLTEETRHFRKEMEKILIEGGREPEGKHLGNPGNNHLGGE